MKVALIVEWLEARRGGAETSTLQCIRHLLDLGARIEVFTRSAEVPLDDVPVHTIRAAGPSRAFKTLSFCRAADRAVRRERYDVIHAIAPSMAAHIYEPRGGTYAETIRRNVAARSHRTARLAKKLAQRVNIKQRMMLRFERDLMTRESGPIVIALSDYVIRQLEEHYALPPERIRKIFNGVDPDPSDEETRRRNRAEVRRAHAIADDELLVLTVAHNFRLKGLRTWIEALALLHGDAPVKIRSLAIGKDHIAPWRRLAERRGLGKTLQFPGPTSHVQKYFHAADVLVHPTFYDPCSRVVLEALASGLPAITTTFDGASEVVSNGANGFVLDAPDDAAGLADRVREMANPDVRLRMREAARQVAARVDMRHHAEGLHAIYREVGGGSRGS